MNASASASAVLSSRRVFLKTASCALAGAVLTGRSGHGAEGATDLKGSTIIDTHTHFYDPSRPQGVPWPPKDDRLLYRTVLPRDYQALRTPRPVTGTVVVEASPWVEDNQWILDLAADDPFIVGLVGNLPIGTEEFPKHLLRFSSNPLFRGIRVGGDRLRSGLSQPTFLQHSRMLAEQDLSLDLLGGPEMLGAVAQLAEKVPTLRLVIEHVAGVRIDGKEPGKEWLEGMEVAAKHSNVYCKVSGLVEGTGKTDGNAPREAGFYRPVLEAVWRMFGEDRLVYGSNWPVSERFSDLATVQGIVADFFSGKSAGALGKVFGGNAQAAYKWVRRARK